ncbi:MAG: glycogen/starch/alpha-glucan phosphorylase [Fibrobacter sp.]|nr:glycogen/starch/alpha-glucan phosphorylase [Fibrobacter sp.]
MSKKTKTILPNSDVLANSIEAFKKSFTDHIHHSLARDGRTATEHEKFLAIAYSVRDRLIDRWIKTQETYYDKDVKRVYYLSLEFLIGRTLGNSVLNLDVEGAVTEALEEMGLTLEELREEEVDAGLGNGGLGRLAACFLDSMATLELPATGMGIRYEYGMFNQKIKDGQQEEHPDNWLRLPNPWEIARPANALRIPFYGYVVSWQDETGKLHNRWDTKDYVIALPYDTPIPGYHNNTVNNLRLWSARSADDFGLAYFNNGDYIAAVHDMEISETISKVLYPNDTSMNGKELRLKQQYFLCSASLQDIVNRFKKTHGNHWNVFPEKVVIQLNDTHPAISIAELMRILLDQEDFEWDAAWDIVTKTFGYTNHTLMPEALEKWPVSLFEHLLPRHLQIIYEINARFLRTVAMRWPGDVERLSRMSIIEEGSEKMVRMAYLSIVGSFSVNGVAALHSELLKTELFRDFFELTPEKFNNKTNGVTPRRWVRKSNPLMSELISKNIGESWVRNLDDLKKLEKFAADKNFQKEFMELKRENKKRLAKYLQETQSIELNLDTIFDVQVKRIHEYKRQLLNVLHVIHLYLQIKDGKEIEPRTVLIGGKAAPGYWMAKQIIRLTNAVASVVNSDPDCRGKLALHFLENYRVSFAEKIIPAADLSEQISTAGTEASGTGNMKFALNGALTIGTLDGANVEMLEEAGKDNFFIFGLSVEQVQDLLAKGYRPRDFYEKDGDLRRVIDLIASGFFSPDRADLFKPVTDKLLSSDPFLLLADFRSYIECQERVAKAYTNKAAWAKMAILNVARMGKFSSDRTIHQYSEEIWNTKPCKISLK